MKDERESSGCATCAATQLENRRLRRAVRLWTDYAPSPAQARAERAQLRERLDAALELLGEISGSEHARRIAS